MLVKVILLFLLAMVLIGMIGKLLFPGRMPRLGRRKPATCPDCGRPQVGRRCPCRGQA